METDILTRNGLEPKQYLMLTVHRPSNTDNKAHLEAILSSLDGHNVIFPAHPRTVKFLDEHGIEVPKTVKMIKPVNYIESLHLVKNARKLLTDSGGMQKEAYFFGTPCITLRDETEWVETVQSGWNVLVGAHAGLIKDAVENFEPTDERTATYGDGHASEKIVKLLEETTVK
jgi:UDP-N-acetylglucosamine 2-epimerase